MTKVQKYKETLLTGYNAKHKQLNCNRLEAEHKDFKETRDKCIEEIKKATELLKNK